VPFLHVKHFTDPAAILFSKSVLVLIIAGAVGNMHALRGVSEAGRRLTPARSPNPDQA
jgi:hypothetical protein